MPSGSNVCLSVQVDKNFIPFILSLRCMHYFLSCWIYLKYSRFSDASKQQSSSKDSKGKNRQQVLVTLEIDDGVGMSFLSLHTFILVICVYFSSRFLKVCFSDNSWLCFRAEVRLPIRNHHHHLHFQQQQLRQSYAWDFS